MKLVNNIIFQIDFTYFFIYLFFSIHVLVDIINDYNSLCYRSVWRDPLGYSNPPGVPHSLNDNIYELFLLDDNK